MRIYLQTPAVDERAPRYCQLLMQKDLLEGWTLVQESGYAGASGRVKREHYATREHAERALVSARDAYVRRGYRVVFVQGEQPLDNAAADQ